MADTSFKKLSNSISVSDKDKSLILVNNEWTFKLPDDIEYKLDTEFDGGYNVGVDLSGDIKTMILKGMKTGTDYKFNVSLSPHYDIFHKFYTVEECRNDNREEDDEFSGIFARASVIDEKNIYVDMTSTNQWPLGQELVIRVRGDKIQPINFFTVLKNYTEDDFNNVATKLIDIAESVKIYKKPAAKKNKAPDVEATLNADIQKTTKTKNKTEKDCFSARAVMKKCQWSIGVPEGFEFSDDPKKNGISQTTGNKYELIIAKPFRRKKVDFDSPYENEVVFVVTHAGKTICNGESLPESLSDVITESKMPVLSIEYYEFIIDTPKLKVFWMPSVANMFFPDQYTLGAIIVTPNNWSSMTVQIADLKNKEKWVKTAEKVLASVLTSDISDYWDDSGFVNSAKTEKQDITTVNTISSEPDTAIPDIELYPHYANVADKSFGSLGITVVHSTRGTQFACLPVKGLLKDKNAEKRILTADTEKYTLHENAKKFSAIFSVSKKAFNSEDDRENDILNSNLKKIEVLHALRSFAWSLMSYCDNAKKDIADVQTNEAEYICNFIAEQNNLNYQSESYFKTLCGTTDLHVAFLPENITQNDKNIFLPSDEDIEYHNNMKAKFPNFNEILGTVASLSDLRAELKVLLPVMDKLAELLLDSRDYEKPLEGAAADVLYAWCTLAIAAKDPFYTEDGPMMCDYSWLGTEKANAVKTKKTESNQISKVTAKATDRSFYNASVYDNFKIYKSSEKRVKLLKELQYREELDNPVGCDLMLKKEEYPEEIQTQEKAYRQYHINDLRQKAREFASVFRVDEDVFDPQNDTENEIYAGYIKHISAMHALKSFLSMMNDYTKKAKSKPIDIEVIFNAAYVIEDCGGSNFSTVGSLCIAEECNIRFQGEFANRNSHEDYVFLGLATQLKNMLPYMQIIYDYLVENRNRMVYLKDTISKILSAWCTLVIASESPFEIVKGLDDYAFEHQFVAPPDEEILYEIDDNGIASNNGLMIGYQGDKKLLVIPEYIKKIARDDSQSSLLSEKMIYQQADKIVFTSPDTDIQNVEFSKYKGTETTSVELAKGTKRIHKEMFHFCDSLREIIIPEGLEVIDYSGIYGCDNLTVTIPASVKEIRTDFGYKAKTKIKAYRDSYAANWLKSKKIDFETILSEEQKEADRLKAIREAEERIAEEKRIAAERKAAYEKLVAEKEEQLKIIEENKGIFGQKAKNRKEAKMRLEEILLEMEKYPEFKE